jgi:hypothetical protein
MWKSSAALDNRDPNLTICQIRSKDKTPCPFEKQHRASSFAEGYGGQVERGA